MKKKICFISFFIILFLLLLSNNVFGYEGSDYLELYNVAVDYLEEKNINWYDYLMLEDASGYVAFYFSCTENVDLSVYSIGVNYSSYIYASNIYYIKFVSGFTIHSVINNYSNNSTVRYDTIGSGHGSIIASSFDVYVNGTVIPKNDIFSTFSILDSLNIYIEESSYDDDPYIAFSDLFSSYENLSNYSYYIYDENTSTYKPIRNVDTVTNNNITQYRYFYYLLSNGTYYFKITDNVNNITKTITKTITNINTSSLEDSNYKIVNYDNLEYKIPNLDISYKKWSDTFCFYTQYFNANDIQNYCCYYTTDSTLNKSEWTRCNVGTYTNSLTNDISYYFYMELPLDTDITTLYFVLYDNRCSEYGYTTTYTFLSDSLSDSSDLVAYFDNIQNSNLSLLVNTVRKKFGFLSYPVELLINICTRFMSINYSEPIIHIPELTNPLNSSQVLFSGTDFNMLNLLQIPVIAYLYDIYLIVVDFIIFIAYFKLCYKIVFTEFLGL